MGHHRFVLLGLAVAVILAADSAAGASKGVPRAGSHRRPVAKTAGTLPSRNQRDKDEAREFRDRTVMENVPRKSTRRSKRKPVRETRSAGPSSTRSRPSATSTSRSSSRYEDGGNRRDGRSRGRGMELVPSRGSPPKSSMFSGLAATMKGKATAMQEDAKSKVTEWRNIAKTTVWHSSKMEKFMIQMTWPDDGILDGVRVEDTMHYLESAESEDASRRTLRKLWLRMTEKDYRTKLKALQILHHTTMDLSPKAHVRVMKQIKRMGKQSNHKNRNEKYFQRKSVMGVTNSGMPFLPLLDSYSTYTFERVKDVRGAPKQVLATLRSRKTSLSEAVGMLRRLDKLICLGMKCKVDGKMRNSITSQVVQLTARDMMDLWKCYVKGLTTLIKGGYAEDDPVTPEAIAELVEKYRKTEDELQSYLLRCKKIVHDRSVFDANRVDAAALEVCLASVAPAGTNVAMDEEDDEESAEGDEDEGY